MCEGAIETTGSELATMDRTGRRSVQRSPGEALSGLFRPIGFWAEVLAAMSIRLLNPAALTFLPEPTRQQAIPTPQKFRGNATALGEDEVQQLADDTQEYRPHVF